MNGYVANMSLKYTVDSVWFGDHAPLDVAYWRWHMLAVGWHGPQRMSAEFKRFAERQADKWRDIAIQRMLGCLDSPLAYD